MIKVVVDTNVLVSAILKDRIPEKIILHISAHPEFEWIVSQEILREYVEVLKRPKFKLDAQLIEKWHSTIKTYTKTIKVNHQLDLLRDRKDR
jgi:putative PIN family toxin of toxin-antitoxin system